MSVRFQRHEAYTPRQPPFQHYRVTILTIKKMTMQILKFGLLVFTLLASSQITWAQTTKTDTTALPPKWEVGLDLLGLFNEGNVPKASIFARRNYARSNQKCKA